jgi:hypothetical protein
MKNILLIALVLLQAHGYSQQLPPLQLRGTVQEERAQRANASLKIRETNTRSQNKTNNYSPQRIDKNIYVGNDIPIVGNNFSTFENNSYQGNNNYRNRNRRLIDVATAIALPLAVGQTILQESGWLANQYLWPAAVRYRPQWYYNIPTYRDPLLNQFDRARYLNNYNGGQRLNSLRGNPPLNWGFLGLNNLFLR